MPGTDIDSPTCGEHGRLATPMHAGAKAMGQVMHRWMGMTDEEIKHDSKYKAQLMAVGLNATLVDALIYAMSKYCALNSALNSDKGYSVGQKYIGYIEHTKQVLQATNGAEAAALERLELIGRAADDLLSIKGIRAYTCRR